MFRINRDVTRPTSTPDSTSDRHDHVVFTLSNGVTVTFNDPRRFGVMDLLGDDPSPLITRSQRWAPSRPRRPSARRHWRGR
jgi:formamidopyrimidine-DNA glycosylase